MGKKENLDINYLNKFDKARTESVEEKRFNNEMEMIAAEEINSLVKKGYVTVKEKRGGKDGQELKEFTVALPSGKVVYYENKEARKKLEDKTQKIKARLSPMTEKRADVLGRNEPMTLDATAQIEEAIRSGDVIQENKYDKDRKNLEESTVKLFEGTIVSYINFKEINKISKEYIEHQGIAQKMAQAKQNGRLPSDNN